MSTFEEQERSETKINVKDDELGDISVISDIADLTIDDYMELDKRALAEMVLASKRIAKGGDFNLQKEESQLTIIMNRLDELRETVTRIQKNDEEFKRDPQAYLDKIYDNSPHTNMTKEQRYKLQAKGAAEMQQISAELKVRQLTARQQQAQEKQVEIYWPSEIISITTSAGIITHKTVGVSINLLGIPYCYPPQTRIKIPISVKLRLDEMLREREGNQQVMDILSTDKIKEVKDVNKELVRIGQEFGSPIKQLTEII